MGAGEQTDRDSLRAAAMHLLHRWAEWTGRDGPPWDWALEERKLSFAWPLLYWTLADEEGALSGTAREQAMLAYYQTAARALMREPGLADILAALAAAGVRNMVCKGAALAETAYASPGLRNMVDVDLFVPCDQILAAAEVLQGLGYEAEARLPLVVRQQADVFAYAEMSFYPPNRQSLVVELHWHPIITYVFRAGTRVDMAMVWERAEPVMLAGQPTLQMSPEDTLFHLCYHLFIQHQMNHLKGYLDIDLTVRGRGVDWAVVVSRAGEWRLRPVVYWALVYARDLLGTPVPGEVLKALAPGLLHPSSLVVRYGHPRRQLADGRPIFGISNVVWQILLADRWIDRLRMMREAVWPRRAVMAARDGARDSWRVYALYPQRLWRGIRRMIGVGE